MGKSRHGLLPVDVHRKRGLLRLYFRAPRVPDFFEIEVVAAGHTAERSSVRSF